MIELEPRHHIFRHIKKSWTDGEFIEPMAFRLRQDEHTGEFEDGLSVNWVEYFKQPTPLDTVAPLAALLVSKGRKVGVESLFALLEVGAAKAAAAVYTPIAIRCPEGWGNPSHALVQGYEAHNDQVAEALAATIIATFPAKQGQGRLA